MADMTFDPMRGVMVERRFNIEFTRRDQIRAALMVFTRHGVVGSRTKMLLLGREMSMFEEDESGSNELEALALEVLTSAIFASEPQPDCLPIPTAPLWLHRL